jgi:hypothetical protein
MASEQQVPGEHVYIKVTSSSQKVDLPKTIVGNGIWLRGYVVKGTPVTAGVPDEPVLSIEFSNVGRNQFHSWCRSDLLRGFPLNLDGAFTSIWHDNLAHIQGGPVQLEHFDLDVRDSTGAYATFSEMHLWLFINA